MGDQERDFRQAPHRVEEPVLPRRPRTGRWVFVSVAAATVLAFAGIQLLTPDCRGKGCPDLESLGSYRPPEPPRIYDERGNLSGQLSGPQRIVVDMEEIPEIVRDGYIAVEDRRFQHHHGVDLKGGARALVSNVRSGRIAQGASTITMQLARNVFGPEVLSWNRFHRKLAEIRLARRIEEQLSKDEILELYLNQIYLGDGVYGVETASRHYFGKPIAEVSVREAALLIGLAKNPEGYNPNRNPGQAKERIEEVLDVLEREGVITAEESETARAERVNLADGSAMPEWGKNSYYLSAVRRELRELIPDPQHREGLKVYTGLDRDAQAAAVDALATQIGAIERGQWGVFQHPVGADSLPRMETSPFLQGLVVAMDPLTGLVTTLVGGRDYHHSEFDRAFQALRQPGSSFKPLVYAAAIADGLRLSDEISTEPVRLEQRGVPDWEPGDHVTAQKMSVRDALVHSSNSASVRVGERVGVRRVAALAHDLGIRSDIPNYPSVFLGAAEVVPAELVAAFAAFGNGGYAVQPHFITRIEDADGRVVYERGDTRGHRALDPAVAFLVLDVMRDVVRRGTGWRVGESGIGEVAGKTGTTNESRDVWFIGMTPALVAGVWLGFDDPSTIVHNGSGGNLAAPPWAAFMRVASRDRREATSWSPPPGVTQVTLDYANQYGVGAECQITGVSTEYFIVGTEPVEFCPNSVDSTMFGNGYPDSIGYYNGYYRSNPYWQQLDTVSERMRQERLRTLDSLDAARRLDSLGWYPPDSLAPPPAPSPQPQAPPAPRPEPVSPPRPRPEPVEPPPVGRPRPEPDTFIPPPPPVYPPPTPVYPPPLPPDTIATPPVIPDPVTPPPSVPPPTPPPLPPDTVAPPPSMPPEPVTPSPVPPPMPDVPPPPRPDTIAPPPIPSSPALPPSSEPSPWPPTPTPEPPPPTEPSPLPPTPSTPPPG